MTIVLVPLISLMIDQIKKIPKEIPAICYNSWIPFIQRFKVLNLIREAKVKILFVTPELFVSDIAWRLALHKTKINLICIDEAHCISEHSHSFRHSYSFVKDYLRMLNNRESINYADEYFVKGHAKKEELLAIPEERDEEAEIEAMMDAYDEEEEEDIDRKAMEEEMPPQPTVL